MSHFEKILASSREERIPLAVAAAEDADVLAAVKNAAELQMVTPILVGGRKKIEGIAAELCFDLSCCTIIDEADIEKSSRIAVSLVHDNKARILMKGLVDTSIIMKAVLDRDTGLRTGNKLSHGAVFELERYHKLLFITDAAMNLAPNLDEKRQLIDNIVPLAQSLGVAKPKVAVICAKEKVDPKMPHTLDAQALVEMNEKGLVADCIVAGPYALDNAVSKEAARHKGIAGPVAGDADILLLPTLEAGNVLYKALAFLTGSKNAGLILGASAPIVLTSRADSSEAKLNSIALAVMLAKKRQPPQS